MADNKFAIGTVGFNRILFGIMDDKEQVTKVVAIDGNSGGAVELKTSGFQGQSNTVMAQTLLIMCLMLVQVLVKLKLQPLNYLVM